MKILSLCQTEYCNSIPATTPPMVLFESWISLTVHLSHPSREASSPPPWRVKIWSCEQLESISEEIFHSSTNISLQSLRIGVFPDLQTLPDCLSNLSDIEITSCKNLELRPHQFQNFTRLKSLDIRGCENIDTPLSIWGLTRFPLLNTSQFTACCQTI